MKTIKSEYIPCKTPIIATVVMWLIVDRFDYLGWLCGVLGCVAALAWIGWCVWLCKAEPCEPMLK